MMGYGWAGGGGGFWMLGGLLLMIGVIVIVVWAVMAVSRAGRTPTGDPSRTDECTYATRWERRTRRAITR